TVAVNLDEAHAAFDEPPRQKALRSVGLRLIAIESVHPPGRLGLLGEVDEAQALGLHPVGQLERVDPPEQIGFTGAGLRMLGVEAREQVELAALVVAGHVAWAIEVQDWISLGTEEGPLVSGREKAGVPVERSALDSLVIAEHDVARQVLVLAPQA